MRASIVILLTVALAAVIGVLAFHPVGSSAQQGGSTGAPDRGVTLNNWCPPSNGTIASKVDPEPNLVNTDPNLKDLPPEEKEKVKDQDKNGDTRLDYFMGQYKFVEGDKDLIVRIWCINKPATTVFHDFFSQEIITSLRDPDTGEFTETPRISPGVPT